MNSIKVLAGKDQKQFSQAVVDRILGLNVTFHQKLTIVKSHKHDCLGRKILLSVNI